MVSFNEWFLLSMATLIHVALSLALKALILTLTYLVRLVLAKARL